MDSGIYIIENNVNGKCYIGSSARLSRRRLEHFFYLKHNKHINKHLQNAYNKYGEIAFEFSILETVEDDGNLKEKLLAREQYYIDLMKPQYNILQVAGSNLGYNHSKETKQKIRETTKGVKKSKTHADNIRKAQKGKKFTNEHRKKLSESAKNRKSPSRHAAVLVDGVVYMTIKSAAEAYNIHYTTAQRRLKNPKFPNWTYVDIETN